VQAWESCLAHDPTCEEAACALMRVYAGQGRRQLVSNTHERCRSAVEQLGLRTSLALDEVYRATVERAPPRGVGTPGGPQTRLSTELRLVSVLFAELSSGPMRIGHRLDPEDLRHVVGGALAGVIAAAEGFGGTVTSVSGTGLVALFGAPEAHEDDPERAVRAGFRVLHAPGPTAELGTLSVRVGIETGLAVVGPLGADVEYGAVGDAVGAAAALQSASRPGAVLVGPATHAATEGTFEWGPTEEVAVFPGAEPLATYYLERPKARVPGYRGQGRLAQAPVAGRQAELSVLDEALREATTGRGSVVFVVGDPGLGKTRLVQECRKHFMAWAGAGTGRLPLWLEGRCSSYASSTPYGLYQQLLSAWTGAVPEDGEEVVLPALRRAMNAIFGGQVDHAAFLANMLGLPAGPEEARLDQLSPEGLQRATFAAVIAVVARLVARGPTVLVLEDLHWSDPTSLHLTAELAGLACDGPLLLLATRRPEPDPGVSALEGSLEDAAACLFRKVDLSPLADAAERELARSLIGGDASEEVLGALRASAEGNPRFLEERFSSLIETGALAKAGGAWRLNRTEPAEVPEVLERLIRARVDRLGPLLRDAIVAASVLGAEFSLSAMATVTDLEEELPGALGQLCATGLLTEVRQLPEPIYRFRHALIQEATYQGMLRGQRRQLHARAAWGPGGGFGGPRGGTGRCLGPPLRCRWRGRPRRPPPGSGRGPRCIGLRQRRGRPLLQLGIDDRRPRPQQ
jgi:class 3 adenylate cyclase